MRGQRDSPMKSGGTTSIAGVVCLAAPSNSKLRLTLSSRVAGLMGDSVRSPSLNLRSRTSSARAKSAQNRRENPRNIIDVASVSGSTNGLAVISSGRLLYLNEAISDHFSPSGRKYETPMCGTTADPGL